MIESNRDELLVFDQFSKEVSLILPKRKPTREYPFLWVLLIGNKTINQIEPRIMVIRKTMQAKNTTEIKYSFTNFNLEQYTHQSLMHMYANGSLSNIAA